MRTRHVLAAILIGLSAFLLFTVEPLSSKELLPKMGGSSAVWLSCLCFFQIWLLVGYLYAAVLTSWIPQRIAQRVQLVALVAGVGWVAAQVGGSFVPAAAHVSSPTWTIFKVLTLRLGLPFLLLSATSPLLQIWLARWQGHGVAFRLFALSNAGSLAALLLYPTLIEPHATLHVQRKAWAAGFLVYCVLSGWLLASGMRSGIHQDAWDRVPSGPQRDPREHRGWTCLLLSAAGAIQLCSVTSHLTENVAALPLLWIVPLGVYLCSFVLAFELPNLYRRDVVLRCLVVMLASLGYLLSKTDVSLPLGLGVGVFLIELFLACWFCHAEIYLVRPHAPGDTARFYLLLAAGGAAGTVVAVVIAPLVFSANYDLPLSFMVTAVAALLITWREGWSRRLLWMTSAGLCLALAIRLHTAYARNALFLERNFYGSVRVKESYLPVQAEDSRLLLHGTIEHGMQWFSPRYRTEPLTYYGRESGVGRALRLCCGQMPRAIGIIGLGAGTVAAYGRSGDTMRFYEINPAVEQVAKELFSYTRESRAAIKVVDGDARLSMEREPHETFDVLVIDAFSGDAIPVHLLTLEAAQLYREHLRPGGVLAFHISNQYVDLVPVLAALAFHEGLTARLIDSPADPAQGLFAARWVLMASPSAPIFASADGGPGEPVPKTSFAPWTDDYSSLLPVVRWAGNGR